MFGEEKKSINLSDLAKQLIAIDGRFESFHGNLFGIAVPSKARFFDFIREAKIPRSILPNQAPVAFLMGDFSSMELSEGLIVPSIEGGTFHLNTSVFQRKIPSCDYLCVIVPLQKTGKDTSYGDSRKAIDIVRSLFCLNWGGLPFYTKVLEFDLDANGNIGLSSNIIKTPFFAAQFVFDDFKMSIEILDRLALQQPEFRARFDRACAFIGSAMDQPAEMFRFSSYWIALEILIGKANAIRDALTKAYSESSKFVDDALHFQEISQMRHNLIHYGIFAGFGNFHERLLHLYFWDIVIHQIGLPSRRLAYALSKSGLIEAERGQYPGQIKTSPT